MLHELVWNKINITMFSLLKVAIFMVFIETCKKNWHLPPSSIWMYFPATVDCNFPIVWHTHFYDNYGMNEITKLENEENRSFDFTFKCRGKNVNKCFSNVSMFR